MFCTLFKPLKSGHITNQDISLIMTSPPYSTEVVLVVPGLGVQISSSNWLGYTSSVFLPHTIIGDIIINEGITRVMLYFTTSIMFS